MKVYYDMEFSRGKSSNCTEELVPNSMICQIQYVCDRAFLNSAPYSSVHVSDQTSKLGLLVMDFLANSNE